jgi:hypothetical protein
VYFIARHWEVVVMDSDDDPWLGEALHRIETIVRRLPLRTTASSLHAIFTLVCWLMPYNSNAVRRVKHKYAGLGEQRERVKLPLGMFGREGGGVCRHQGLLAAAMMERLVGLGLLNGKWSVERNMVHDTSGEFFDDEDEDGNKIPAVGSAGHAWARFTEPDGTVWIVDPAQGWCRPIEDIPARYGHWRFYARIGETLPTPSAIPLPPLDRILRSLIRDGLALPPLASLTAFAAFALGILTIVALLTSNPYSERPTASWTIVIEATPPTVLERSRSPSNPSVEPSQQRVKKRVDQGEQSTKTLVKNPGGCHTYKRSNGKWIETHKGKDTTSQVVTICGSANVLLGP